MENAGLSRADMLARRRTLPIIPFTEKTEVLLQSLLETHDQPTVKDFVVLVDTSSKCRVVRLLDHDIENHQEGAITASLRNFLYSTIGCLEEEIEDG